MKVEAHKENEVSTLKNKQEDKNPNEITEEDLYFE